jgi:hypothetical protein
MTDALAGGRNLERMWNNADRELVLRRMREFAISGVTAHDLGEAVSSSGHSDPTVAAALAATEPGTDVNLVQVAIIYHWATRVLERAMANELTRDTEPPGELKKATDVAFDSDAVFRPGAGTCAFCGRDFAGGRRRADQVRNIDGVILCYSHETLRRSPHWKHRSIEDFMNAPARNTWTTANIPQEAST